MQYFYIHKPFIDSSVKYYFRKNFPHVFVSCPVKKPEFQPLNEQELIQQLRSGNEQAFKYLVETFQDRVFNTAIGIVQNEQDAEDVAQEVFIQIYRSIHGFKGESQLSTWIYRIATTRSFDLLRSRKSKKRFAFLQSLFGKNDELVHDPPDFYHPGVAMEKKEDARLLAKAITRLPENQRIAFTLNKLEELSYQEVSNIMKTTVSAVESLLHRAKQNLRKELEKEL
jgi:RNA polymerase sigma factor (sigma-70 family)